MSLVGLSVRLGRSGGLVRPAMRGGVEDSNAGDISPTVGASLAFGRRYGAHLIADRWVGPSDRLLVMALVCSGWVFDEASERKRTSDGDGRA